MRLVFVETYQWFSIITPVQVAVWVSSCRWGVAQKCTARVCGVLQTSKKRSPFNSRRWLLKYQHQWWKLDGRKETRGGSGTGGATKGPCHLYSCLGGLISLRLGKPAAFPALARMSCSRWTCKRVGGWLQVHAFCQQQGEGWLWIAFWVRLPRSQPKGHTVCISAPGGRALGNVQRGDLEEINEFLFSPLSICSWEERKSQEERTQDAVRLAWSYHKLCSFQHCLLIGVC